MPTVLLETPQRGPVSHQVRTHRSEHREKTIPWLQSRSGTPPSTAHGRDGGGLARGNAREGGSGCAVQRTMLEQPPQPQRLPTTIPWSIGPFTHAPLPPSAAAVPRSVSDRSDSGPRGGVEARCGDANTGPRIIVHTEAAVTSIRVEQSAEHGTTRTTMTAGNTLAFAAKAASTLRMDHHQYT